jgi:chorismate mutase
MRQRLLLMHDVARWKWNSKKPIADPAREHAFLEDIAERARRADLDPAWTRSFFAAQIEAAKLIQEADFRTWTAEQRGPFPDAADLSKSLRPRIDEVSHDLLGALVDLRPRRNDEQFRTIIQDRAPSVLTGRGIDDVVRRTALKPLVSPQP